MAALAACLATTLTACKSTSPQAPDAWDGLRRHATTGPGTLYMRPDVSFTAYRTVMLDALVVVPDKDWAPARDIVTGAVVGSHPVSSREKEHIEKVLGSQFQRIVAAELEADGFRIVTHASDDTLRISPALINVYLNTPEDSLVKDAHPGTMTLVLDLSDAGTGLSLARFVEEKRGRMGSLEVPLSVTDNAEYRQSVEDWAQRLHALLDRMKRAREAP